MSVKDTEVERSVRQAVIDAGGLVSGHFVFADGAHALVKIEMDFLWEHPEQLAAVLDGLAQAEGLPEADVILGVPSGGQRLADVLGEPVWTGLPVVKLQRVPGGTKQDFEFVSEADRELALGAKAPRIYEDVVTTLSSIAGVVKLLEPERQDVRSLAIWRRGEVKPKYQHGVQDHYLVEEAMTSFAPEDCPVCRVAVSE